MKIKKFIENYKNREIENKLLKTVIAILAVCVVIEGMFMVYLTFTYRTVIIPAYVDKKFYVEGDKASPEYVEMMAKYAVELISNYTPETIDQRTAEFLRFITPDYYAQVSPQLLAIAKETKSYSISQYFIPQRLIMKDDNISITGFLRQFSQDKQIDHSRAEYKMSFKINQGRFEITNYEKIEGRT